VIVEEEEEDDDDESMADVCVVVHWSVPAEVGEVEA
jgi:hypothetical protein